MRLIGRLVQEEGQLEPVPMASLNALMLVSGTALDIASDLIPDTAWAPLPAAMTRMALSVSKLVLAATHASPARQAPFSKACAGVGKSALFELLYKTFWVASLAGKSQWRVLGEEAQLWRRWVQQLAPPPEMRPLGGCALACAWPAVVNAVQGDENGLGSPAVPVRTPPLSCVLLCVQAVDCSSTERDACCPGPGPCIHHWRLPLRGLDWPAVCNSLGRIFVQTRARWGSTTF